MATYRQIYISFWSDPKIDDDFTPEDKYFYLYLLTNEHTSISGCYEISMKQLTRELGYNEDTVRLLIKRMEETHGVIRYCRETKEILVLNWHKYNWSKSPAFVRGIREAVNYIKCAEFREYVLDMMDSHGLSETVGDGMVTSVTVTVTDTVTDTVTGDVIDGKEREEGVVGGEEEEKKKVGKRGKKEEKEIFHKYGEYGWVRLTDRQYTKLVEDFGEKEFERCVRYVDESAQGNHNKNGWTDWNLVLRRCHREGWGANKGYGGKKSLTFMDLR